MKLAMFNAHKFEQTAFELANASYQYDIHFFSVQLNADSALMARGFDAVCCFVNDCVDSKTITQLVEYKIPLIALRCAGFNNVDLREAQRQGVRVVRVPAYSPYAIAEHAMTLLLCLNRKVHHAYLRVMQQNFSLEGLVGFDLHGRTVGIVGTGRIGAAFAAIANGFGCRILAFDHYPNTTLQTSGMVEYVELDTLLQSADIISLHLPLTPDSYHIINAESLQKMKSTAVLINTSRGALIDAVALIQALKTGEIAGAGLDVYEEEESVFFEDLSERILQDDTLARLMTFPNVLITAHQGFLTEDALSQIATTTLQNIDDFIHGKPLTNEVLVQEVLCSAGTASNEIQNMKDESSRNTVVT